MTAVRVADQRAAVQPVDGRAAAVRIANDGGAAIEVVDGRTRTVGIADDGGAAAAQGGGAGVAVGAVTVGAVVEVAANYLGYSRNRTKKRNAQNREVRNMTLHDHLP